jgi:hypothetical protein
MFDILVALLKIADDKQLFSGVNDEVKLEVNDAVNNYMIV